MADRRAPVAIVGPTAVGKSAAAESLALACGGEVVSADSMQVYRGMDIGTAKTPRASRRVPHHCLDIVEPGSAYSAALFQRDARRAIDDIGRRGLLPVVCGGTGLYVRAALDMFEFPSGELGDTTRSHFETLAAELGPEGLHALLAERDPAAAASIHPHNVRRVVRALEMTESGVSYADQAAGFASREPYYPGTRFIGLTMERDALYARIERRVHAMIADGLLGEIERLLSAGYRAALTASQAIGYKELVPVLEGAVSLSDATDAIVRSTRRYAKRQLTWFRGDPRTMWIDVTELSPEAVTARVIELLESTDGTG